MVPLLYASEQMEYALHLNPHSLFLKKDIMCQQSVKFRLQKVVTLLHFLMDNTFSHFPI